MLTLSDMNTLSEASAADDFWKQFDKNKNGSICHNVFNYIEHSIVTLSFVDNFHIFLQVSSKSSAADLLYVGKG